MEELALNGGPALIQESLPPQYPGINFIDETEKDLIISSMEKGGIKYTRLDEDLKAFYGCKHALAVNSGTAALYCATAALGLGPGMEVLVPGFAWIPTYACIVGRGAVPVLVEVGEDLNMDPEDMERKITPRTKAAIVVHMCGAVADMDPIMQVVKKHDLKLIEDCAQAGGMKYKGKYVGTFGDLGCFSLQQNKHITSYTGGYVLTNDDDLGYAVNLSRDCGMQRLMEVVSHTLEGEVMWGMGYGMNRLARAMARAQLAKLPKIIAAMQRAQRRIIEGIGGIDGVRVRSVSDADGDGGSFLITTWPDEATALKASEALKAEGVPEWTWHLKDYGCHMYYHVKPLVQKRPWIRNGSWPWDAPENRDINYSYGAGALPKSDEIFAHRVLMAVPATLTDQQCDRIAAAYRKVAAHLLGADETSIASDNKVEVCAVAGD